MLCHTCSGVAGLCRLMVDEHRDSWQPLPPIVRSATSIDPVTGWFVIHEHHDKRSIIPISNMGDQKWVFSSHPTQVTYFVRGGDFVGSKDLQKNYQGRLWSSKGKPNTVRNPQAANATMHKEFIHQVTGNIIMIFKLERDWLDKVKLWKGILSTTAFAVCSTFHVALQNSSGQLAFRRNTI
jgi:hypothetical protein